MSRHGASAPVACAIGLAFWLALALPAFAELEFPPLTGRVVDEAGLLSSNEMAQLERMLEGHENATSNQIVVVTLDSLQGRTIEEFGYQLGRAWGIGQKGRDNGALLIVAPNEREVRIEVGYGLEGMLTDAVSSNIIHAVVLPAFRRGDMPGGIRSGAMAMVQAVGGEYQMRDRRPAGRAAPLGGSPFVLLILGIFVFVMFGSNRRSGFRRGMMMGPMIGGGRSGFGGGGFGGGFGGGGGGFGGGGGGFGGGGASGGW